MATRDSENVEMAPLMVTGPANEDEDNNKVAHMDSFVPKWRFCYMFFKWPLAFLVINGVVTALILAAAAFLLEDKVSYYNRVNNLLATNTKSKPPPPQSLKSLFTAVILAFAMLVLLDALSIVQVV